MIIIYRLINRCSTFEGYGSIPTPPELPAFLKKIQKMNNNKKAIFCGGHQNMGVRRLISSTSIFSFLFVIVKFNNIALEYCAANLDDLSQRICACAGLQDATMLLMGITNIGKFFAWQITCDLVEIGILPDDNNKVRFTLSFLLC